MTYKAFVSSTFADLKNHRARVIETLRNSGFSVDPMENWTAAVDEPKHFSQDRVQGCDLCVLLIAFRRGHVPEGETRSITQLEHQAAVELGIDVLPFMLDEQAPWPRKFDELDKDPELQRWRATLMEHQGVGLFGLEPDTIDIAPALTRWITHKNQQESMRQSLRAAEQNMHLSDAQHAGGQVVGDPPYKGMQSYDTNDAPLFFGREALTAELVAYLRDRRFLAVVGASGSGKSSVVRAGLVPAVQKTKALPKDIVLPAGSERWPVHIMTPKAHPLKELAATLTRDSGSPLKQARLIDELAEDRRVLDLYVSQVLSGTAADRLLLVVDQFEELFTLCKDQTERKAFIDNLLAAATDDGVTTVVITVRADFYAHCFAFDNLRIALSNYQIPIGPMNRDELRSAIEEPARQEGWQLEPGLVEQLLLDLGNEPGALPLLSHALLETWKRRRGRTMTLAGYVESGRVQGAIAQTAEHTFMKELTSEQQAIAKHIFMSLTELGEGAEDTRRRVQLIELMPRPAERAVVEAVLLTLVKARLVTTDEHEAEVAHEALIRQWPRLREWLNENRDGLRVERRMAEAAREWDEFQRDTNLLYRGSRFDQAWEWVNDKLDTLSPLEREFIETSRALVETEKRQSEVERLLREAREAKQVGKAHDAIAAFAQAGKSEPNLNLDLEAEIEDVRRQVATRLVQAGERLAAGGKYAEAAEKFKEALALAPPPDTPVYVWIPPGEFLMGS
ncbi:MAG: DUF4062 domain-containing protein, partial [Caldilineaceae bacterium]|nr:DUF4062 domain-containing protein [Caldilineaceae bacterium]